MPQSARNVVNIEEINAFVYSLISSANPSFVNTWLCRNLKNYLIRKYSKIEAVTEADEHSPKWLKKAINRGDRVIRITLDDVLRRKLEHVTDYFTHAESNQNRWKRLSQEEAEKRITRISVPDAIRKSEEWTRRLHAQVSEPTEEISCYGFESAITVYLNTQVPFHWVPLTTPPDLLAEGDAMNHCVGGYGYLLDEGHLFFSLRTENNKRVMTVHLDNKLLLREARCRSNSRIPAKYINLLEQLLLKLDNAHTERIEFDDGYQLVTFSRECFQNLKMMETFVEKTPEARKKAMPYSYLSLVQKNQLIQENWKNLRIQSFNNPNGESRILLVVNNRELLAMRPNPTSFQYANLKAFDRAKKHTIGHLQCDSDVLTDMLLTAIRIKSIRSVRLLASWGARCPAYKLVRNRFGGLITAHQKFRDEVFRTVIDLNAGDIEGNSALHYAVAQDTTGWVNLMMAYGADIHARNKCGVSVLTRAISVSNEKMIDRVLSYGADPSLEADPLIAAVKRGEISIISRLIKQGTDVNAGNKDGDTALMTAAGKGNKPVLQYLLKQGAAIDQVNRTGYTALMLAAAGGHDDIVSTLIRKSADINSMNRKGTNALICAIEAGEHQIVERLLKAGIYLDTCDENGDTALMLAVRNEDEDLVETLLQQGADPDLHNHDSETAWSIAVQQENPAMQEILQRFHGDDALDIAETEDWDEWFSEDE